MPEIPPLTADNFPKSYRVKQHILDKEIPLYDLISDIGDLLRIGRGLMATNGSGPHSEEVTGRGLCVLMCSIIEDGLPMKFRDLVVGTTVARITPRSEDPRGSSRFVHTWSHCQFKEEGIIFSVDLVPRQTDPNLPRIIVDEMTREPLYYSDIEDVRWLPKISIDQRLEGYYRKSVEINGASLNANNQRRLRSLAYDVRNLLAT